MPRGRLRRSVAALRSRGTEQINRLLCTAETQLAAGVFSAANGYWGDPEIPGIGAPIDLTAGLTMEAAALFVGLKTGKHVHNLGNGAIAAFVCRKAYSAGLKARADGLRTNVATLLGRRARGLNDDGTTPSAASSGAVPYGTPGQGAPPGVYMGVTDEEAAAAVAAAG